MKKIFIIDDNETNRMTAKIALEGMYTTYALPSAAAMFKLMNKIIPDLILLDIEMPEMDGYETIKKIKEFTKNPAVMKIPVIFLTALAATDNEYTGLLLGAADYITKPFNKKILQKRIETHLSLSEHTNNLEQLVEKKTGKIVQLQDAVLSTVAEMVEFRDDNTGGHIERTLCYLRLLVEKMNEKEIYSEEISVWDINSLIQSAELHDVGKICIPDSILSKPGRLTDEEFDIMKTHTIRGKEAIMKIIEKVDESEFLHQAALMAYTHHEKWDGSGYPQGLKGEDIPLHGRLMAIADVYDALISIRPYKKAFTHEEAVGIIVEGRGTQFDPVLTDLFKENEAEFCRISQVCNG
jgi:putative two-component system response regulator